MCCGVFTILVKFFFGRKMNEYNLIEINKKVIFARVSFAFHSFNVLLMDVSYFFNVSVK